MEFNKYQTQIKDFNLETYPTEVVEQFLDYVNNIPFIQFYTSKDRPYAKDLPRDKEGKVIVDITHPHILEDMDYFRPAAIHFQKHGCYTLLRPNPNPNSEYGKWIREEIRRCWYGYVRESDGEWIPGDYYYYLNYCPIQLIKKLPNGQSVRTIDFPKVWDGQYLVQHYLYNARLHGHHASELSSRGKGKSFMGAGLLSKRFKLGESEAVKEKVLSTVTASDRKYIWGPNQILNMFKYYIDFQSQHTQFPRQLLTDSAQALMWESGYKDKETGVRMGTQNAVVGVTTGVNQDKLNGSRGVLYLIEEAGIFSNLNNLYQMIRPSVEDGKDVYGLIFMYGCVCAGTKVWTLDGRNINIENLKKEDGIIGYDFEGATKDLIGTIIEPKEKECLRITLSNGNTLECSIDHPILTQIIQTHRYNGNKRFKEFLDGFIPAKDLKIGSRVCEARYIDVWGNSTLFDARLVGMLIGDGSYGLNNTPKFSSEDHELLEYIKNKYEWGLSASHITKKGKKYEDIRIKGICSKLREIGIYGQTKLAKRLPSNYQILNKQSTMEMLGGLYDTDGSIYAKGQRSNIMLTQANKFILEQIQLLLRKIGVLSSIVEVKATIKEGRKDRNNWYNLVIAGRENILNFYMNIELLQEQKKKKLSDIIEWFSKNPSSKPKGYRDNILVYKIVSIENIGIQTIYNMSAVSSHTYLANNIITHNTAGDDMSDFTSLQEIMYHPDGYNMEKNDNVWDKEGQGGKFFTFFYPAYLNRANCMDDDGNSDVIKALLEICVDRFTIKYSSTDINAITKRISQYPITPQEAILRTRGSLFPVTQLNERLNDLDANPDSFNDVYVGQLVQRKDGEVEFKPTNDIPIRDFPLKDNKAKGAIEIFEMPQKDKNGKVFSNRYILGHDPVDDDSANTMSLTSTFVLDLFTDRIVAEYTGRQDYADDNFEIVRLLCLFYNGKCLYEQNKKGIFAYFSQRNCVYLLADTPQYLKDQQIIKEVGYGNKAKGVVATAGVNNFANQLIKEWLIKPVPTVIKEDGEDKEITISNLFFIRNRALLKELILFNPDINVDRVRALGMVMLYRQEFMILYGGDINANKQEEAEASNLANDDFFTRNYDLRFNRSKFSKIYTS